MPTSFDACRLCAAAYAAALTSQSTPVRDEASQLTLALALTLTLTQR